MNTRKFIICYLLILVACCLFPTSCSKAQRIANIEDEAQDANGLEIYRAGKSWVANVISPSDSSQNLGVYIFPDTDNETDIPSISDAVILPPSKLKNIVLFSSVYSSALKELSSQDKIKAVGDAVYFTDTAIQGKLKRGDIIDVGTPLEPVAEKILSVKPDLILVSDFDGADLSKLRKLNIPIIYLRESSETKPLGRAEWIKLLGLIAGQKEKSDSIYNSVKSSYNSLKQKAEACKSKPLVMTELMYEGTWFVPGGQSYAANLIKDAGGKYIWDDDKSAGSLQQSFEAVFSRGSKADFWITHSFGEDLTLNALQAKDAKYMMFNPAKSGGLWNVNTKTLPFYDETPFHPERLLKDYICIFQPSVLPNDKPHYFHKVQ